MAMFDSVFKKSFNPVKCKTLLKLTTLRIKLLKDRREVKLKQMRRELAKLLETNQEPSAHIGAELIYKELNIVAAYNIIELFCELLASRLSIIVAQKLCPIDLKEAVSSIIYAAPRCSDVPELKKIRSLFTTKYGKEFATIAAELLQDCGVNRVVVEKLSMKRPSEEVRLQLMKDIATKEGVVWSPKAPVSQNFTAPEELIEGASRFFSASQHSMQKSFKESSIDERLSAQKESIMEGPDTHVVPNTKFSNGKQFISFIRPTVKDDAALSDSQLNSRTVPIQRQSNSSSHLSHGASTSYSSHRSSATSSHEYEDDADSQLSNQRRTNIEGVANAALAAAESAEQAAAAARAAAHLASRTFARSIKEMRSSDSESDNDGADSQLHERSEDEHVRYPDPDDSLTSRMPRFNEPADERGFRRMDASVKAPLSYGKSREDPSTFRTDSYNFDKTDSPSHATTSQERLVDDQRSQERQKSSFSFSNILRNRRDYIKGRSFQIAGGPSSLDTYKWDERPGTKPADETPRSGPPARPPLQPPSSGASKNKLTKSVSFVHPKLPDCDMLTAHFQALKAARSG